jgi:hypothetical protein
MACFATPCAAYGADGAHAIAYPALMRGKDAETLIATGLKVGGHVMAQLPATRERRVLRLSNRLAITAPFVHTLHQRG